MLNVLQLFIQFYNKFMEGGDLSGQPVGLFMILTVGQLNGEGRFIILSLLMTLAVNSWIVFKQMKQFS